MDADTFLREATDPDAWLAKSVDLRRSADRLWDCAEQAQQAWLTLLRTHAGHGKVPESPAFEDSRGYMAASRMLYGMALEAAFKGHILRHKAGEVAFEMTADGSRKILSVELKKLGVDLKKGGHDLGELAKLAGLFKARVIKPKAIGMAKEVLRQLSEAILWTGRYPAPRDSQIRPPLPPLNKIDGEITIDNVLRDFADPILDKYQGQAAKARYTDDKPRGDQGS